MSAPIHDLSKLRIDRNAPPVTPSRSPKLFVGAIVLIAIIAWASRFFFGGAVPVQVVVASLPVNGVVANTTNWASFSEIAFAFQITPGLLLAGLIFAAMMGILGGYFPARRASKLQVVEAIRR